MRVRMRMRMRVRVRVRTRVRIRVRARGREEHLKKLLHLERDLDAPLPTQILIPPRSPPRNRLFLP